MVQAYEQLRKDYVHNEQKDAKEEFLKATEERAEEHAAALQMKEDEIENLKQDNVALRTMQDDLKGHIAALQSGAKQQQERLEEQQQQQQSEQGKNVKGNEMVAVGELEREIARLKLEMKEAVKRYELEYKDLEEEMARNKEQMQSEIDKVREENKIMEDNEGESRRQ